MDQNPPDQSSETTKRPQRSLVRQFLRDYVTISAVPVGLVLLTVIGFMLFFVNYSAGLIRDFAKDLNDKAEQNLQELGERAIEAQAKSVADQLVIYLQANPETTFEQLQLSQDFKELAVQPVGETGYTAVYDSNGITHFHINPDIVGKDMHELADALPNFWAIFEASLDGTVARGYYEWQDADGTIRDKYMVCVSVGDTNLRVAATTYIDEFSLPVLSMRHEAALILSRYQDFVYRLWYIIGGVCVMVLMLVVAGVYVSGRRASIRYIRPIVELAEATERLDEGQAFAPPRALLSRQDEIGTLTGNFTNLIEQLQQSLAGMEQHSRALALSSEVSQRMFTILDLQQLMSQVVEQIRLIFNYYHAHIYLLDNQGEKLVVAAGTGEAGAAMQASGHSIALNAPTSPVARAARSGEVVSVDDVHLAEGWLPNPLLPDTYSEMSVPIMLEGQVVGALDVQEDKVAGLDESDANLLRMLANQVAVAIRNAQLFEEVETALAEARAAQERYLEQSWQQAKVASLGGQYRYAQTDAPALSEATVIQARQAALTQADPAVVALGPNGSDEVEDTAAKCIVAPVKLQDMPIGTVQLHPLDADRNWSDDDLAVVEAVVDELAQAAENLRLFEETRERAGREQTIREITDKMRSAINLDELVEITTQELGERLSAGHTVLKLGLNQNRQQPTNGDSNKS